MADPMYTDSLWIKSHPAYDNDAKNRTHGEHYIYYNTINRAERLEMIYRSIGKQYDWDLEKYRNTNKSIDKGNKRRFWKNGLRFFKHPLGYIFWKGFVHGNSKRLTHFMFIAMLGHSFMLYHLTSEWRAARAEFELRNGANPLGDGTQRYGLYENRILVPLTPLTKIKFAYSRPEYTTAAPSSEQGFRKHFDLKRTYGISSV